MRMRIFPLAVFVLALSSLSYAQPDRTAYAQPQQPLDPIANISLELSRISRSVTQLSERLAQFVDKFEKVGGITLTEKQQRLVMGLEVLVRSEQRVATLQKQHADLMEKQIPLRQKVKQAELDMRPQSIDRSTQLQGSTDTVERRENRYESLLEYQRALTQAIQQIDRNLYETESALREAQAHVNRLRRSLLPQIEREIEATSN